MPYRLPEFNQTCTITTLAWLGRPSSVQSAVPVQVMGVSKLYTTESEAFATTSRVTTIMKFPARTYVLGQETDPQSSLIQVDDDEGTTYRAKAVWDVGQGFGNEYRAALVERESLLPGQAAPPEE